MIKKFLSEDNKYILNIDTEGTNIIINVPGRYANIEKILDSLGEYYNPIIDFKTLNDERITYLFNKYAKYNPKIIDFATQIVGSTYDYIENHLDFPIIYLPETCMHILLQQELITALLSYTNKFIIYTNSPNIVHGNSEMLVEFNKIKK